MSILQQRDKLFRCWVICFLEKFDEQGYIFSGSGCSLSIGIQIWEEAIQEVLFDLFPG